MGHYIDRCIIGVLFTTISLHVYIIIDKIKNRASIKHKLFAFPSLSALKLILRIPGSQEASGSRENLTLHGI